jgi:eukaryotic-like serine/threonine-protein kinase
LSPGPEHGSVFPSRGRLGRYDVLAKIADGGMAAVYVARRDDGEIVALKRIRDDFARNKEFLTMLLDEAKIVSYLSHPNIVRYHELGDEDGHAFLTMELLLGQSLWSVWEACRARGIRLRYDTIAWIGARVCDGLQYAHELRDAGGASLGIVHRDVNATNIFVTYDGEVKIIDFGLAKAANRAYKTAAGVIKGKVAYMSPEQALGHAVDRRTDVFALGTTLWELACDRRLFKSRDDVETLERVHEAKVPDPTRLVDGFPPALWAILRRALAKDPDDRPQTAAELGRELDAFARMQGEPTPSVLADVMRELFAEDRARQLAWIADVSAPGSRRETPPLKPRSTFYGEDPPASVAPPVAPPGLALGLQRTPYGGGQRDDSSTTRRLVPIVLVIAAVVATVVSIAFAIR